MDSATGAAVSIRAPARGATFGHHYFSDLNNVSIRAPARGATGARPGGSTRGACFNPRPREGGDPVSSNSSSVSGAVSIRAPARGATVYSYHIVKELEI